MKAYKAAFVAIMAAAALSQGCATVATHYQVRAAYEQEARQNVMRGKPALCAVAGEQKRVDDIGAIEMIKANLLDYAKALVLDLAAGFVVWYIAEQRRTDSSNNEPGATYISNYYPAADDAGGDDDGGASE
jgi:hypothetical protein